MKRQHDELPLSTAQVFTTALNREITLYDMPDEELTNFTRKAQWLARQAVYAIEERNGVELDKSMHELRNILRDYDFQFVPKGTLDDDGEPYFVFDIPRWSEGITEKQREAVPLIRDIVGNLYDWISRHGRPRIGICRLESCRHAYIKTQSSSRYCQSGHRKTAWSRKEATEAG